MTNNPFNILGGQPAQEVNKSADLNERIKNLIASAPIFLFMKGSPDFPQCGFSANVVGLLGHLKVSFKTFDILSDMDIREGVKQYSNWPTYPQLYVNNKLIGGNDIIMELFEAGELEEILKV